VTITHENDDVFSCPNVEVSLVNRNETVILMISRFHHEMNYCSIQHQLLCNSDSVLTRTKKPDINIETELDIDLDTELVFEFEPDLVDGSKSCVAYPLPKKRQMEGSESSLACNNLPHSSQ
jgi:hypothetical protein